MERSHYMMDTNTDSKKGEKNKMYYGYHRVSTKEQHLDRGIIEITNFCNNNNLPLEKIYEDKVTGKVFVRPRYTVLKEDVLRSGDCLIITEVDRLGRNKREILRELEYFRDRNIRIMILEIPTTLQVLDFGDNEMAKMILETINNMLIEVYATFAHAELEKKKKRQEEGIAAKKERGEWDDYGRPRVTRPDNWNEVISLWESGQITAVEAMKRLQLKKTTFYRMLKEKE